MKNLKARCGNWVTTVTVGVLIVLAGLYAYGQYASAKEAKTRAGIYANLKKEAEVRDYDGFAKTLKKVYEKQWDKRQEFIAVESDLYMKVVNEFLVPEKWNESLRISTIVYNQVSASWRFRYLRITTLDRMGRRSFKKGNLQDAEEKAREILKMTYRPEGANLLADVYIQKIEQKIRKGDIKGAQGDLAEVWDYEVNAEGRGKLEALKKQLEK